MRPDEALPLLLTALEKRAPRIRKNRRYSQGKADLPEMGNNLRASWAAFQKKARTNYGGLLCHSLAGRMMPVGVRVGNSDVAASAARQLWRDNRLEYVFQDAIWNMLSTSVGYVLTDVSESGRVQITSERPEQMITLPDPAQPWRSRAAVKVWRNEDLNLDLASVWVDGGFQMFSRAAQLNGQFLDGFMAGSWAPYGSHVPFDGGVPVQVLENLNGMSEFEEHVDVIDRINLGKLNRLVITAMQAFKQRAIKGDLSDTDEDGNDVDWSKTFEPAPGALWELPEGVDIWESAPTDIRPLLDAEKADARDFAAVTQAPISIFIPDGQNQSAEGAISAKEGEIAKANRRISIARPAFEGAVLDALRMMGADVGDTVEIQFAPPAYVSYQEKADAAKKASEAGMSRRWIARNIWGLSADEISELETDAAIEQLSMFGAADGDAA